MNKVNPEKLAKLRAKKASKKSTKTEHKAPEKEAEIKSSIVVNIDFDNLTVNGHRVGDPLPSEKEAVKPVKMFWDEPAPLMCEPELFKQQESDVLDSSWLGWKDAHFITKEFFFNDFGYFKEQIKSGQFPDFETMREFSQRMLSAVNDLHRGAVSGDEFGNGLMRLFGLTVDALKQVHGIAFFKMLELIWNVGHATSITKTKNALHKKAEEGDLEAQKTILKQYGVLTVDAKTASSGELRLFFDGEDSNA